MAGQAAALPGAGAGPRPRLDQRAARAPSQWSEPAWAEAALLEPGDWVAQPVGGAWPRNASRPTGGPPCVRREFTVDRPVVAARLYATAHGVYEAEINGARVGDDALSPGWTVYGKRLKYRTYDVTSLVAPGRNAIGAWLGDGWYRGRLGFNGGTRDIYGTDQSWLAQLEIRHDDGSVTTIATDELLARRAGPDHHERPVRRRGSRRPA